MQAIHLKISDKVLAASGSSIGVSKQPIRYVWVATEFLAMMMLHRDIGSQIDQINYLNQKTQIVWPGSYHCAAIKEYNNLKDISIELEAIETVLRRATVGFINIKQELEQHGIVFCTTLATNVTSLMAGNYEGVTLDDRNWIEVYNGHTGADDEPYDPTKDPSAADLDDDEAEEEAEYHAHNDGPLEGREESVNDHNINAFLQIPIAQPTGNDEHLQRVIDAVKTVQSYVEIVQKTLHPIHPDPTRNSPVAQNAQFMNEVMSESDEDEDDDGDDRMSQDANELKEDAIPFTNSRGTFSDRPFAGLCVPEMIAIIQKSGAA
eukprot:218769_1